MGEVNVLFVCTENLARSPTAALLFRELQGRQSRHEARAVGTAPHAPRRLTTRDLAWAGMVAVMEPRHLDQIRARWPRHAKKVVILEVEDHFIPSTRELRQTLEPKIRALLERCDASPGPRKFPEMATRPLKRGFDIALSGLGLIISAPLWILIALLIKLDDGGPVFYGQERVGRGGRRFRSLKFRSMVPDADRRFGPRQAGAADARVTRVGRWLRATAMDELPQLWNIFRGDMSFVGPRALMPAEIEVNGGGTAASIETVPGYRERHRVAPGLTGLAQIYADRDVPRRHKFKYDLIYIRRQSLALDLKLIALSFWITARGKWEHRGSKF